MSFARIANKIVHLKKNHASILLIGILQAHGITYALDSGQNVKPCQKGW